MGEDRVYIVGTKDGKAWNLAAGSAGAAWLKAKEAFGEEMITGVWAPTEEDER